jgi:hypothetical protein
MDETISILGQTILILVAFACLVALVFFILVEIRAVLKVVRQLKAHSSLPPTDAYIPQSFDAGGRS